MARNGLRPRSQLSHFAPRERCPHDTKQTGRIVDADLEEPLLTYQGEFAVPQTHYRVRATFHPDFTGPREQPVFKSHRSEDPGVFLEISDGERSVFRRLIRPGESADFDGKSLTFDFYKLWYCFSVTEDWGPSELLHRGLLRQARLLRHTLRRPRRAGRPVPAPRLRLFEVWSLISWFVYAIYFHLRRTYGWKGTRVEQSPKNKRPLKGEHKIRVAGMRPWCESRSKPIQRPRKNRPEIPDNTIGQPASAISLSP